MNRFESKYFATAEKMDMALIKLLDKKAFEYITIKEICEEAGVNRSTFYLHYQNTRELLSESVEMLIKKFVSYFPVDTHREVKLIPEKETNELFFITPEYILPYLSFMRNNKNIFIVALKNPEYFDFDTIYKKLFLNVFSPVLEKFRFPAKQREYVMSFYLNGINGIVTKWIDGNCVESDEEICAIIEECIMGKTKL